MSNLVRYAIAGGVLASMVSSLGAGMPLVFMTAIIGPPLLHLAWLVITRDS